MKLVRPRRAWDLAILAAVVAVGGAALADALRERETAEEARDGRTATAATTEEREAPSPRLPGVAAPGLIAFTSAGACELRVFDLRAGRFADVPRLATTCELWPPRVGAHVAYGVLGGGDISRFTVLDLDDPQASFGEYERNDRFEIAWGPDGTTLAWCDPYRWSGFELSLGQRPERLDYCPLAYDPGGVTATINVKDGRHWEILIGGRPLVRVRGYVEELAWGVDGSLAVNVNGRRVDRYEGDRLVGATILPPSARNRPIDFAPDNCAALAAEVDVVRLIDLGCFRGRPSLAFEGADAAWSPDGEWIAVAEPDAVVFHRVVGREATVRWGVAATQLAWLSG